MDLGGCPFENMELQQELLGGPRPSFPAGDADIWVFKARTECWVCGILDHPAEL